METIKDMLDEIQEEMRKDLLASDNKISDDQDLVRKSILLSDIFTHGIPAIAEKDSSFIKLGYDIQKNVLPRMFLSACIFPKLDLVISRLWQIYEENVKGLDSEEAVSKMGELIAPTKAFLDVVHLKEKYLNREEPKDLTRCGVAAMLGASLIDMGAFQRLRDEICSISSEGVDVPDELLKRHGDDILPHLMQAGAPEKLINEVQERIKSLKGE